MDGATLSAITPLLRVNFREEICATQELMYSYDPPIPAIGFGASFASTSSDATEDSWFEDYVREPRLGRAPLDSRKGFIAMHELHDRMFVIYQRLHRRISKFCR